MIDKEKVIKGLEKCKRYECDNCTEKGASQAPWDCPAYDNFVDSALALLKEQKAREPHYTTLRYIVNGTEVVVHHPECPRCFENGLALWDAEIEKGTAYCKRCGQAVKWND